MSKATRPAGHGKVRGLLLGGALILVLTGLAIRYEFVEHAEHQAAELESIGESRAQMVGNWLKSQSDPGAALRSPAGASLLTTLAGWPVPSRSAASTLVRRDGDMLVGVQGNKPLRVSTPELLAARVLRGEVPYGQAAFGRDFRGVEVFGAVMRIQDSDWLLVSRIEAAEMRTDTLKHAAWIAAARLAVASRSDMNSLRQGGCWSAGGGPPCA